MSLAIKVMCRGKTFPIPKFKSFNHVSNVAEIIADYMSCFALGEDWDASNDFQVAYYHFLFLCGWTEESYNREMLERTDQVW